MSGRSPRRAPSTDRAPAREPTSAPSSLAGNSAAAEELEGTGAASGDTPTLDAAGLGGGGAGAADPNADGVGRFIEEAPGWITHINDGLNPLTADGQLVGIDDRQRVIVDHFRTARERHDRVVAQGAASEAATAQLTGLVLGMLPGLGDVAGQMAASGPFLAPLNAVRSDAQSRTMAGFSRTTTPGSTGPSTDAFALHAEQSKTEALRALLQLGQAGSNLEDVTASARAMLPSLQDGTASAETRQNARQIAQLATSWAGMQQTVDRLVGSVQQAQQALASVVTAWSPFQLEAYLWVTWVGALGDDGAYHLGPDAVEQRLGFLGITGPGSLTGADLAGSVDLGGMLTYVNPQQILAVRGCQGWAGPVQRALDTYTPTQVGSTGGGGGSGGGEREALGVLAPEPVETAPDRPVAEEQEDAPEAREPAIEGEDPNTEAVATFVQDSLGWIHHIDDQVNPLTLGGRLTGIDDSLGSIVSSYRAARAGHQQVVARGAASEAATSRLTSMALGMLPGLGDVTGMMAVSNVFMTPLNAIRGHAEGEMMGALDRTTRAGAAGVSDEAFALRAERSRTEALRALVQVTQTGSNIAQVREYARGLLGDLRGGHATASQRENAARIARLASAWSSMQRTTDSLVRGVQLSRTRLAAAQSAWTSPQLEIYLWVVWVGSLGDEGAYHLGPDAIEERLNARGITGRGSLTGADLAGSVDLGGFLTYVNPQQIVAVRQAHGWIGPVERSLESYNPLEIGSP